jgi:pyruvate dehydrogenase E1 component
MPGWGRCAGIAQAGDIPDLYRAYGLDTDAILDACAEALLGA